MAHVSWVNNTVDGSGLVDFLLVSDSSVMNAVVRDIYIRTYLKCWP